MAIIPIQQKIGAIKNNRVTGIGSALVDILLQESEQFVANTKAPKGGMSLVDNEQILTYLKGTKNSVTEVPGGSACNTIIGIGKLGGPARFIGKRGQDRLGTFFEQSLIKNNVEPVLMQGTIPTGNVLSVITPDAQRTMYTYLGASTQTTVEEITSEKFAASGLVHIEGYLLFNQELIYKACASAKQAGALISLDLASFTVVEHARGILRDIIEKYVDVVLANEDEAFAYTGEKDERKALEKIGEQCSVAVVKIGKRGSLIMADNKIEQIGIMGDGTAVDTTGAGDLWASGFLYGLINKFPIKQAGTLGAACGYEVCQVIGAQIGNDGWERIMKVLKNIRK